MFSESEARAFAEKVEKAYLEERRLDFLQEVFDDDATLIGTGKYDVCRNKAEIMKMLDGETEYFPDSFRIVNYWNRVQCISGDVCLVFGELQIQPHAQEEKLLNLRLSILLQKRDERIYIKQMHFSAPNSGEGYNDYFPNLTEEKNEMILKRMVEEKTTLLEQKNREYSMLTENVPGGILQCLYDEKLTLVQLSDGFLSMFGFTRAEIEERFQNGFMNMIDPQDRARALEEVREQLKEKDTKEIEYRVLCKDGSTIWVLDKGQLIREGEIPSFFCILVDISQRKATQEELRLSLERYQILADQSNDIIFEWDIVRDTMTFSPNWKKKFGTDPMTRDVSHKMDTIAHVHPKDQKTFLNVLNRIRQGSANEEMEIRLHNGKTEYVWCRLRLTAQQDNRGRNVKAVGVIVDIDVEKRQREELIKSAQRDTLTKLYNKGASYESIQSFLRKSPDGSAAIMIVDIDDFKNINDSLGHLFGDAVLTEFSNEMMRVFSQSAIVGRVGGDEFIVCLTDVKSREEVEKKARQMVDAVLAMDFNVNGVKNITCSVGIAMYPEDGRTINALYRKADHALYYAKNCGKNRCEFFETQIDFAMLGNKKNIRTAVNAVIDSDKQTAVQDGNTISYIFHILYQSSDIIEGISNILELVGKQFNISRVYIFENSESGEYYCNTFEWCNENVEAQMPNLQRISYEELGGNYNANFDESGIFYCQDISVLPPQQRDMLKKQGIKAMLQCAIFDSGAVQGFVGFDECRQNRFWTQEQVNVLSMVAEILSIFLLKSRAQTAERQSAADLANLLEVQNAWIYVVKPDTYEMVYLNKRTKTLVPGAREGLCCYKAFFNADEPCENCPVRHLNDTCKSHVQEVYNPVLKLWTYANAAEIQWRKQKAILLTCNDITQFKFSEEKANKKR